MTKIRSVRPMQSGKYDCRSCARTECKRRNRMSVEQGVEKGVHPIKPGSPKMRDSKWPHVLNQNVKLEQTDSTAGYVVSQNMLEIAIDLATHDGLYECMQ